MLPQVLFSPESHSASSKQSSIILCQFSPVDALQQQQTPNIESEIGHFRIPLRNHSNENEFDLHESEPVGGTHFHMNGFARRLGKGKGKLGNGF